MEKLVVCGTLSDAKIAVKYFNLSTRSMNTLMTYKRHLK